jgi:hypothetical protein
LDHAGWAEQQHVNLFACVGESLAEREAKWNAFIVDPEWLAVRAATEKDGPIVASIANSFLEPTPFSSMN